MVSDGQVVVVGKREKNRGGRFFGLFVSWACVVFVF
jgi:hypothetical protein